MAELSERIPRPFDAKTIEHLISLMGTHDLSEIDLHDGEQRIRLRRGVLPKASAQVVAAHPPSSQTAPVTAAANTTTSSYHEIKSPMVGTFYSKSAPDKEDYVKAGSKVKPDSIVCKLEAMKLFNDLPAECTGTIVEICVKNGQAVDFGTVLFRVDLA